MYFNFSIEVPESTKISDPDIFSACNHVSCNLNLLSYFHSDCHNQILRVINFRCNPLLMYKRGATFRMMPRCCHMKSGLITLMFNLVVFKSMISRD